MDVSIGNIGVDVFKRNALIGHSFYPDRVAWFIGKSGAIIFTNGMASYAPLLKNDGVAFDDYFKGRVSIRNNNDDIILFNEAGASFSKFPLIMDSTKEEGSVLFISEFFGVFLKENNAYNRGDLVEGLRSCFDEKFWKPSSDIFYLEN